MKTIIALFLFAIFQVPSLAQEKVAYKPRVFFSSGFVTPHFYAGTELMRSYQLRQNGLSYFENSNGERKAVGDYGANTGFSLSIGYYIPVKKIERLALGLLVNSGQTGSTPSGDGYAEGYFFNFLNFGAGAQYYPLKNAEFYVKGEFGMGSVFTKNRFVNEAGQQDYLHHFGIGLETGGSLGYTIYPFQNKELGINLEASHQFYNTRVEVTNIGNDNWQFGATHLSIGIQF